MKLQLLTWIAGTILLGAQMVGGQAAAGEAPKTQIAFDIQPQPVGDALNTFASQSGLQVLYLSKLGKDVIVPRVQGTLSPEQALEQLLESSGLRYEFINPRTIRIWSAVATNVGSDTSLPAGAALRLAQSDHSSPSQGEGQSEDKKQTVEESEDSSTDSHSKEGISELLVRGARTLNVDIKRDRDDAQPYVVFSREELQRSGATDLNDFFRKKLTMNTQGQSAAQAPPLSSGLLFGNSSEINLRGLGSNQTLILVDGRRLPSVSYAGTAYQPNINGIPFAAIERIEVLPTTASGIYGGSATGGALNIVMRHDYSGMETQGTYSVAQDSAPGQYRLDFSVGHGFEGGKTNAMLTASYQDTDDLLVGDRDFMQRGRARIQANNPAGLLAFGFFPPYGSTPNILSADGTPLFGPGTPNFTSVPVGYAGGGGLAPLQANAGQYNLDFPNTAQSFGTSRSLLPRETSKFLTATLRREFSSNLEAFLEGRGSEQSSVATASSSSWEFVSSAAATNPFGKTVIVSAIVPGLDRAYSNSNENYQVTGGVIVRLAGDWTAETDYGWGQYTLRTSPPEVTLFGAFNAAVNSGAIDLFRDTSMFPPDVTPYISPPQLLSPARTTSTDVALRLAGSIFSLPAGRVKVSSLLERRKDWLKESTGQNWNEGSASYDTSIFPSRGQTASSAYVEFTVPLVGEQYRFRSAQLLELQLAGRYEEYEVIGATDFFSSNPAPIQKIENRLHSFDPTLAVRYKPLDDLMLRASYGEGFLPPTVQQLISTTYPIPVVVTDPKRNNEVVLVQAGNYLIGGNPNLRPEESESWSAGLVFTPSFLQGVRVSVDYTNIKKTDNITSPFIFPQDLVNAEDLVPDRIARGAPSGGFGVGPITGLNQTSFNIAQADVEAYDVALDYEFDISGFGSLHLYSLATWQTHYKTQLSPTAAVVENIGVTVNNPLRFKANGGITWRRNAWTAEWSARYFDDYLASRDASVILSQGNGGRVPSQIYHDFFGSYQFSEASPSSWLRNSSVQLGIQNAFDKTPPVDLGVSYIYYSTFGDPRLRNYTVSIKKGFD